ncbi:MAG: hypothetical protein JWQ88_3576 [Rhodoferax sp.]|nr:hypothetical protein [Rhodoferax sp.]
MGPIDSLIHVMNFLAPAAAVALLTALGARICLRSGPSAPAFLVQAGLNFLVGATVLVAGLVGFGSDGKMATYAALVLGCATVQAWMLRGGKR